MGPRKTSKEQALPDIAARFKSGESFNTRQIMEGLQRGLVGLTAAKDRNLFNASIITNAEVARPRADARNILSDYDPESLARTDRTIGETITKLTSNRATVNHSTQYANDYNPFKDKVATAREKRTQLTHFADEFKSQQDNLFKLLRDGKITGPEFLNQLKELKAQAKQHNVTVTVTQKLESDEKALEQALIALNKTNMAKITSDLAITAPEVIDNLKLNKPT